MQFRAILASLFALLLVAAADTAVQQVPDRPSGSKPWYDNVESQLSDLIEQAVRGGVAASAVLAARAPLSADNRVAVTIYVSGDIDPIARFLTARGGGIANLGTDLVEAYVDLLDIPELTEQPGVLRVEFIKPPTPLGWAQPVAREVGLGDVVSEGVRVHNAARYHNANITGRNVKVGVIDVGFGELRRIRNRGELPKGIRARCYTAVGRFNRRLASCERGSAHGTAVAEALLDVAPGARLYVANPLSRTDLQRTMRWMANQGVKIINHSVGWVWSGAGDGTPVYSDSPLLTVAEAARRGVLWVNAAGNEGRSTWSGRYRDRDSDGWLEFTANRQEQNRVRLHAGKSRHLWVQLRWQDTWFRAETDLDLFLMDASGNTVARSLDLQQGSAYQDPFEIMRYTAPGNGTRNYFIRVEHYAGPSPRWFQVQAFLGQTLQRRQAGRSIGEPADSADPGVLAVGASHWRRTGAIENFSSRGPTRDGRFKPDIVGADGGTSAVWGPWFGTSQASPHVAGLAALLLQQDATLTPVELAGQLKRWARQRGARPNNRWGYGFAWLRNP